ncbi:hypothetical protein F5884DRAFT_748483 [Xylogone sp. PMI_703]|nr:hypothetical protein F5884DRAFT_748483 [Xylogone sp. PMI_703]
MTANCSTQPSSMIEGSLAGKHEDLWDQAILSLDDQDRALVKFQQDVKVDAMKDVLALAEQRRLEYLNKRWTVKYNGKVIILRDVFEKLIKWVNNFMMIGDVVVQFDPGHAALPWAGVRLLLQWAVNDSQIFGAMIEGLEVTANLISRYSLFEALYLQSDSSATNRLRRSLVSVYASILIFLGKTLHFYNQNVAARFAKSLVKVNDTTVNQLLQEDTTEGHTDQLENLCTLLKSFADPLFRISANTLDYQDYLEKNERLKTLEWLSPLPYPQYHDNARADRLADSGQWMPQKPQFKEWSDSSYSSILWLHGIPGSGKTKLASIIVDEYLQRAPINSFSCFAYFYCARDPAEPERANPLDILRCIARQLSSPSLTVPVQQATLKRYKLEQDKGVSLKRLNFDETLLLILELINDNPATIVIDALDECDPECRHELFRALNEIIQKSSNIVKVFVTSRDDGDITCHLEGSPNIYIDSQDNAKDIERFITVEIEKAVDDKKLLHGNVSDHLKNLITETLKDGAQGMFRWVSLQLQNLCNPYRMKLESDVRMEIERLPRTLSERYAAIYSQIEQSSENSRRIGKKALAWTLAANAFINTDDLIALIASGTNSSPCELSVQSILDLTCNLLIVDSKMNTFRFAHLSVREYLESVFENDRIQLEPAQKCLEELCVNYHPGRRASFSGSFYIYAHINWGYHCSKLTLETRCRFLFPVLFPFLFDTSTGYPQDSVEFRLWKKSIHVLWPIQWKFYSLVHDPFFAVCRYGVSEIIRTLPPATVQNMNYQLAFLKPVYDSWERVHGSDSPWESCTGMTGLHIAARFNQLDTVEALLDQGVSIETRTLKGKTALHVAAETGNVNTLKLLHRRGANLHATTIVKQQTRATSRMYLLENEPNRPVSSLGFRGASGGYESVLEEDSEAAIHFAAYSGDKEVVQFLLNCGAEVDSRSSRGATPLHKALEGGREEITEVLIDSGADPNTTLLYGRTPLHFAAALGQKRAVDYLLRKGADPNLRDVFGNRPYEVALQYGYNSITDMLRTTNETEITLEDNQNWLLDFKGNKSNLRDSIYITEASLLEWKNLPVRNKMLEDISARRERERRIGYPPSHLPAPKAFFPRR